MTPSRQQQLERNSRDALVQALAEAGCEVRSDKRIRCPFHQDDHPSAEIKRGKDGTWRFHCYAASCGFHGDVYDVRAKISGKAVETVLREARGESAPTRRGPAPSSPPAEDRPNPPETETAPASEYDRERRYKSLGEIERVLPGLEGSWVWVDESGVARYWTLRFRPPGERKHYCQVTRQRDGFICKGPKPPYLLLNLPRVLAAETIIVVEGEPKVDVIEHVGLQGFAATSPLGGAGLTKEFLTNWRPLRGKTVFLWPDADEGGLEFMQAVGERLRALYPRPRIFWISPAALGLTGTEDVVDYLRGVPVEQQQRRLLEALDRAEPWQSKRPSLAAGVRAHTEGIISGELADAGLPFGRQLARLSRATAAGTVTIVGGVGGAMKTWLLLFWAMHWFENDVPFAYYALEEDRKFLLERIEAIRERNISLLDAEWVAAHPDEKRAADKRQEPYLHAIGQHIWDAPNEPKTLPEIAEWGRRRAAEGRRVLVVDPVTATRPERDCYLADRHFLFEIKTIARLTKTTVVVATHRAKGRKGYGLDDLAGGAAYGQLAQSVVWIERYDTPKEALVMTPVGRSPVELTFSLHIVKGRQAPGVGKSVGFIVDWPTVEFREAGVIVKEPKKRKSE